MEINLANISVFSFTRSTQSVAQNYQELHVEMLDDHVIDDETGVWQKRSV